MTTEALNTTGTGREDLGETGDRRLVALARLAIGLAQGIALYILVQASEGDGANWSERHPELFGPAVLVALFLPAVLLSGVGRLRPWVYAVWSVIAAAVLAFLAWHDITRQAGLDREATFPLFAFAAVALFIAHHLIVPADRERRLIAPYPAYFDAAWMAGVQLVLSIGFAGAFWLLLFLGAALFNIIGLSFLGDLLEEAWFVLPMTGLAFATAVQLTDVRDGLIRGVRTVALMLLSWLLLVLTVLVGAFLAALPFTGLDGLWETGSATALVLAAAGILVVLINAAYQDGRADNLPPSVLRVAVRVASVLLTPLILIAAWGLSLRIGQHGLTPDRIIAIACAVVGAAYAGGYGYAALRTFWSKGDWMRPLERTNIGVAVLAVVVILALFTPVADPARLSVSDQVSRLKGGKVAPEAFDYAFLQSGSGKAGQAALADLATSDDPAIADRAKAAQAGELSSEDTPPAFRPTIAVLPGAPALPEVFFQPVSEDDARRECRAEGDCLATVGEAIGFPQNTVLLVQSYRVTIYGEDAEFGTYIPLGTYVPVRCGDEKAATDARDLLRQGKLKAGYSDNLPDLDTGGERQSPLSPAAPFACPPAR